MQGGKADTAAAAPQPPQHPTITCCSATTAQLNSGHVHSSLAQMKDEQEWELHHGVYTAEIFLSISGFMLAFSRWTDFDQADLRGFFVSYFYFFSEL